MKLETILGSIQNDLYLIKEKVYTNKIDTVFTRVKDTAPCLLEKEKHSIRIADVRDFDGILILKLRYQSYSYNYTKEVTITEFLQDYKIKEEQ